MPSAVCSASSRTSSAPIRAKNSELETTLGPARPPLFVVEKNQVDVRAVVQLLATQLAQPEHHERRGFSAGSSCGAP